MPRPPKKPLHPTQILRRRAGKKGRGAGGNAARGACPPLKTARQPTRVPCNRGEDGPAGRRNNANATVVLSLPPRET